ncbi:MAG: hypothetical protein WBE65_01815 [Steroidobacteraceae bacterium]
MAELNKSRKRMSPAAPMSRQKAILFESRLTRRLSGQERLKVVKQLAQILMLATGIADKESDVER